MCDMKHNLIESEVTAMQTAYVLCDIVSDQNSRCCGADIQQ
jgi:hypothetical protein